MYTALIEDLKRQNKEMVDKLEDSYTKKFTTLAEQHKNELKTMTDQH